MRWRDVIVLSVTYGYLHRRESEAFSNWKLDPKAKIIVASGYIDPEVRSEILKAGAKHFIQKPYVLDDVLRKIREVIDMNS